jgi:hypothetical protein
MAKITFIGAGSTVFAKNLLGDILLYPELGESTICLFDIDQERLATSEIVARKVASIRGAHPTIGSTTDRRRALDGSDYAILQTGDGDRFLNPQKIWSAADHRRHTRDRRDYARPADDPGAARNVPGYGRALP